MGSSPHSHSRLVSLIEDGAFLAGGPSWTILTEPVPKNAPWHNAATILPTNRREWFGARAHRALPRTNRPTRRSRTVLRGIRAVAMVTRKAPTATARA